MPVITKKTARIIVSLTLLALVTVLILTNTYNSALKRMYPIHYNEYVDRYSKEYGVSPQMIYAVIRTESGFDSSAESDAGAVGLMQIMPETFYWLQLYTKESYDKSDLYDPEINIKYGTYYLSMLYKKYESDKLVLCAYNAGIGSVNSWLKDRELSDDGVLLNTIPYRETAQYVKKVLSSINMYQRLYYNNQD